MWQNKLFSWQRTCTLLYQPRLLLAMLQCSEGDAAKHGACPK